MQVRYVSYVHLLVTSTDCRRLHHFLIVYNSHFTNGLLVQNNGNSRQPQATDSAGSHNGDRTPSKLLLPWQSSPSHTISGFGNSAMTQKKDFKSKAFLTTNENGRLFAIEDPNTDLTSWESGANLKYILCKYDKSNALIPLGNQSKTVSITKSGLFFY